MNRLAGPWRRRRPLANFRRLLFEPCEARRLLTSDDERIDPATFTEETFHLTALGQRLPGRVVVSSTERFATYFHDEPLPAATAIRVIVDGDQILGRDGLPVDADGDNQPGGRATDEFRTLPLTRIPVPPDRIPAPLPPGQQPPLVISIQAGGATRFDAPASVEFPNLEGLPAGETSLIFSFDHAAGRWNVVGTGTVSVDGRSVGSDGGVIRAPGWHFTQPGSTPQTPPPGRCDGINAVDLSRSIQEVPLTVVCLVWN